MISVFFYALLTDRAYLAHWQDANPVLLEDLFERPNIDWSFDPDEMRKLFDSKTNSRFLTYEPLNSLNQKWGPIGRMMFPKGPSQNFKDLFNASVSRKPRACLLILMHIKTIVRRVALQPSFRHPYVPGLDPIPREARPGRPHQGQRLPLHHRLFIPPYDRSPPLH